MTVTEPTVTNLLASEVRFGHWVRLWGWDDFHLSLGKTVREDCPITNNMSGSAVTNGNCKLGHVKILWATDPDHTPPEEETWLAADEPVEVLVHEPTLESA